MIVERLSGKPISMSRKISKESCRICNHDNCHGLAQKLPCCQEICGYEGNILKGIFKPWCIEFVPSDNLEYLEYMNEKKSKV